ncbi:hypothetical protein [Bradyrhizobium sp. RDI18]|uniref:hypothetical protein n=1 Tax=Bradyrhizobium sp. RDI18 TaxID=3367400 RepID=UPI00371B8794
MRERVGLSGSRAGNDKKRRAYGSIRADAVLDGPALLRIEAFQILIGIFSEHESPHVDLESADSGVVATTNPNKPSREPTQFEGIEMKIRPSPYELCTWI